MLFLGVIFALVGVVLATNFIRAADFLVASVRPFPAWMRAPYSDTQGYYRVMGGVFVIFAVICFAVGLRERG